MGDKGEGGVKNLKKWVTSFMDSPLEEKFLFSLKKKPDLVDKWC